MRFFAFFIAALISAPLTAQTFPGFSPLVDLIKPDPLFTGAAGPDSILGFVAGIRMTVAPDGDVYFVSRTTSDFPGAKKIGTVFGNGDILVVRMDARLEEVRSATIIGGGSGGGAGAWGLRVDDAGNLYMLGGATADDFPYTHRFASGQPTNLVLELSSAGDRLIYATQLDAFNILSAFEIDASGNTYIGARTDAGAFVLKVNASGDAIVFQERVGQSLEYVEGLAAMPDGKIAWVTHSTLGALNATGSPEFATTLTEIDGINFASLLGSDALGNLYVNGNTSVVAKFSSDGMLLGRRQLPRVPTSFSAKTMAVTTDGAIYLMGNGAFSDTRNALDPCRNDIKPPYGTAGLNVTGSASSLVIYGPDGSLTYSSAFAADNVTTALSLDENYLYVYGRQLRYGSTPVPSWSGMQRIDLSRIPASNRLAPFCIIHGATYLPTPLSPGEIATIFGSNLGPQTGTSFTLVNNMVPTELNGSTVTVDGVPTPILYAQDAQINFIVPWDAKTQGTVEVCVNRAGEHACLDSTASAMLPAFFRDQAVPIVVHQDGTLNSQANPAHPGQYVSLYLTGAGALTGPLTDGGVWDLSLHYVPGLVTAWIIGDRAPCGWTLGCQYQPPPPSFPADVVYAGSAPFLVEGASQINIRIPNPVPFGGRSMPVLFGDPSAPTGGDTVTIWIAP